MEHLSFANHTPAKKDPLIPKYESEADFVKEISRQLSEMEVGDVINIIVNEEMKQIEMIKPGVVKINDIK